MTQKEFWEHVAKSKRKDPEAHGERLTARLVKLPPDDILDFIRLWDNAIRAAYNWKLWGAAYLINGGCSDDGFHYFCGWLILKGRDVFQTAMKKPDTLADVVDPDDFEAEYDDSPGIDAWFAATGTKPTDKGYAKLEAAERARHGEVPRMPDLGNTWDHDDDAQMRRRLPRLWALYDDGV